MKKPDIGLTAWQHASNHNRMIEFQQELSSPAKSEASDRKNSGDDNSEGVELTYFGSSAFRLTSPAGLTVMLDPWRNHPSRHWDWYFKDFPLTPVDIGVSTHAHFDHIGASSELSTKLGCPVHLHPDDFFLHQALPLQGQIFGENVPEAKPVDHKIHDEETFGLNLQSLSPIFI